MTFSRFTSWLAVVAIAWLGIAAIVYTKPPVVPELPEEGEPIVRAGWEIRTDPMQDISFQYPTSLGTTYITAVDWPPTVKISDAAYSCATGSMTEEKMIGSRTYCITKEGEGAAGSTYTTYAYVFPYAEKTATLSFSLKATQCLNYDDPAQTACLTERDSFNPDEIADQIAGSVSVAP